MDVVVTLKCAARFGHRAHLSSAFASMPIPASASSMCAWSIDFKQCQRGQDHKVYCDSFYGILYPSKVPYLGAFCPWTDIVVSEEDDGFLLEVTSFDVDFSVARFTLDHELYPYLEV